MKFDLSSAKIRKYLVTGVLVWVPVIITIAVIAWGMGILQGIFASVIDAIAAFLPTALADEFSKVKDIPGLGVVQPDPATKDIITDNLLELNADTVDGLAEQGL